MTSVGILHEPGVDHFGASLALRLVQTKRYEISLIHSAGSGPVPPEHTFLKEHLCGREGITIVPAEEPRPTDVLFFRCSATRRPSALTGQWLKQAGQVFGMSDLDAGCGALTFLREFVRTFPFYRRCRGILTRTAYPRWHPLRFYTTCVYYPPGVHPQFVLEPSLTEAMFGAPPEPTTRRDISISFLGSRTPESRATVLRRVRARLCEKHRVAVLRTLNEFDTATCDGPSSYLAFWVEYDERDKSQALRPEQFVSILDHSSFALCPQGWAAWTHRLTEAAIRGTIPVADENECRLLGLGDGVHAVSVRGGDWEGAIDRALAMSERERIAMRTELSKVAAARFVPDAAARELVKSLGF